jgi:predicted nucleotidyltransferase
MHEVFLRALSDLGVQAPSLLAASELSEARLEDARRRLLEQVPVEAEERMDVVALGSLARRESTIGSDFDYLVIAHSLPTNVKTTRRLVSAADELADMLQLARPGATGLFGRVIAAPDLTERIGLEQDTNATHTRRMLLLEESASVYSQGLHSSLIRSILERYLADHIGDGDVPRFLLNDMIRYWRTVAVDYQAKRWESLKEGWGLRYLKLIISRKLTFAGALVSLFLGNPVSTDYLHEQFSMPSLARLAQLHSLIEDELKPVLKTVLQIAEEFCTSMSEEGFREEARLILESSDIKPGSPFDQMKERGKELQEALEVLFFDTDLLGDKSRRYLSF